MVYFLNNVQSALPSLSAFEQNESNEKKEIRVTFQRWFKETFFQCVEIKAESLIF